MRSPKVELCLAAEDLRPISLTRHVLSKVRESYASDWLREYPESNISESQFGGVPGLSAALALVYLYCINGIWQWIIRENYLYQLSGFSQSF